MEKVDTSFYDNRSKFDLSFYEYFKTLGGTDILVNHLKLEIYIMGENKSHKDTLALSRSAKDVGLKLEKLLNSNRKVDNYSYGVLLNGFNNYDW